MTKKQKNINKVFIEVVDAKYIEKHKIMVFFNDNTYQTIDIGKFLKKYPSPIYNKYRSIELFKQFYIDNGNIFWGENADLCFHCLGLYNNDLTSEYDY
ncbi:MAG: DUF2442 domain-containing protein [Bacteroidetes bacterium]|nr:DUF2442 domain-containing protein [Bacteroidota bacterium]